MKFYSIFFISMISFYTIYSQQNKDQTTTPTINLFINTANQAHLNQSNDFKQDAHHVSVQKTNVVTKEFDANLKEKFYEICLQQSKSAQKTSARIITWATNNKLKALGMNLLLLYCYLSYQIYQANLIINHPNSWSNWHNSRTLDDLFATSQTNLEADLLFAIQTRYVDPVNPTDFIYSLVQSSISLHNEIKILQEQITRYQWLENCKCLRFFCIDSKELLLLKEKHRKLSFIKHLFSSWCANYKIDKNS
ncbi:MAG: hypothetical protein JO129_03755 [Candidatus Dependentiae bacterium]|nr:hypothetical protein [Candidatus Dependentiae bacterium]